MRVACKVVPGASTASNKLREPQREAYQHLRRVAELSSTPLGNLSAPSTRWEIRPPYHKRPLRSQDQARSAKSAPFAMPRRTSASQLHRMRWRPEKQNTGSKYPPTGSNQNHSAPQNELLLAPRCTRLIP